MNYNIDLIFIDFYPADAAVWCNNNNCYIKQIEDLDGHKRFKIVSETEATAKEREEIFLKSFFKVSNYGYYRRQPKGYQSAIESINTAFNMCSVNNGLPANVLIFYPEPNFSSEQQCSEEWLVAHQIKLPAMTAEEFGILYDTFITIWNNEEH